MQYLSFASTLARVRYGVFGVLCSLIGSTSFAQPMDAIEADRQRIRAHLSGVEARLRAADVSHLNEAQREARSAALDELHSYWQAGEFPHNNEVPGRNPVFIDEEGRACAVGWLLIATGSEDVAHRIAEHQNLARVPAIRDEGLAPWLEAHGLTAAEATLIQPSYCHCGFEEMPVCGADGVTYENRCTAEECRGVDVVAENACSAGDEVVRDCSCDGPGESKSGGLCALSPPSGASPGAWLFALPALLLLLRWRRHHRSRP